MQPSILPTYSSAADVSILTGPEGPVQLPISGCADLMLRFQSSPVPRDRCNLGKKPSKLTQLFVSILTGPEGPVQPEQRCVVIVAPGFNPHRSRGTGATYLQVVYQMGREFQSSPVPRDRCNKCNQPFDFWRAFNLTGPEGPVQHAGRIIRARGGEMFQSSPVPRDRCNSRFAQSCRQADRFQSSPVPRDRCN